MSDTSVTSEPEPEPEPIYVRNGFTNHGSELKMERSRDILQSIIEHGCDMTPDAILDRLTQKVKEHMTFWPGKEVDDYEQFVVNFTAIATLGGHDGPTPTAPDESITAFLQSRLRGVTLGLPNGANALAVLLRALHSHARVPFAALAVTAESPRPGPLTQDGLLRAAALLRTRDDDQLLGGAGSSSGTLAGRKGSWATARDRSRRDRLRLLFRGLAVPLPLPLPLPLPSSTALDKDDDVAVVSVPQFRLFDRAGSDDDDASSPGETWLCRDEDERAVDTVDVLAHTTPSESRMVARPVWGAFAELAAGLPTYDRGLGELGIPRQDFVDFVAMLLALGSKVPVDEAQDAAEAAVTAFAKAEKDEPLSRGWLGWLDFERGVASGSTDLVELVQLVADEFFKHGPVTTRLH